MPLFGQLTRNDLRQPEIPAAGRAVDLALPDCCLEPHVRAEADEVDTA